MEIDKIEVGGSDNSKVLDQDVKQLILIKWAAILVVVISLVLLGLYFKQFGALGLSSDNGHWGTFGDYFGGVINPIVGMLTVFLVLHSIRIQRRELRASLDELAKSNDALILQNSTLSLQNFEQTFFSWLKMYREQIAALQLETHDGVLSERTGLMAMKKWYDNRFNEHTLRVGQSMILTDAGLGSAILSELYYEDAPSEIHKAIYDSLLANWEGLYRKTSFQLDGSFRTLYRLITWIDNQPKNVLNSHQKWFYVGIVRAQLSWIEGVYQYYNGLTDRGSKFRVLSDKYALFDNLDFSECPSLRFIKFYGLYSPNAFSSETAKCDYFAS
ncbi:hypothetical protein IGS61_04550 [Janthinobacterium sp. FW305-129]|uniref:putative phage abortive infection protein n=1 Tax=Janthinobacterium sp. FW305-129 TaxID=2775054 RepID=UPI001E648117|nr:putative phage abortive infection protein [Janthinobacterium sp. FW305-129]MCC7596743.1 hypothetical protein [Janthinobacterium sp. FW305-129]